MIYSAEALLEDIYKKYPEVTQASIKKVCKKGITNLKGHLRKKRDVEFKTAEGLMIFFTPQTPEKQSERVALKLIRDNFVNEKANRE